MHMYLPTSFNKYFKIFTGMMLLMIVISIGIITTSNKKKESFNTSTYAQVNNTGLNCTLYVSVSGTSTGTGTLSSPLTLPGAATKSKPGDVICIAAGTYKLTSPLYPNSGSSAGYITYTSYNGEARIEYWGNQTDTDTNTFHMYHGRNYIEINGLTFDGRNISAFPLKCDQSFNLRFINNTIVNGGSGGIGSIRCDYLRAMGNKIYHNGYLKGWSSGISLNSNQWSDQYLGIHNYIVNNIISGTVDKSGDPSTGSITDGNGIILDLSNGSYDPSTANSPPALVANNVIYENGGRCIIAFVVTNAWIVNNTCYKNTLDLRLDPGVGEIAFNSAKNSFAINNIAYSWNNRSPFQIIGQSSNIQMFNNISFGGSNQNTSTPIKTDPQFDAPLSLDPSADGQYNTAVVPWNLGSSLTLKATSPAINKGIDPTTIMGISSEIAQDIRTFLIKDIEEIQRPIDNVYDIGAYEFVTSSSPTPTIIYITPSVTPSPIATLQPTATLIPPTVTNTPSPVASPTTGSISYSIYGDVLNNQWFNQSWGSQVNYSATSPTFAGNRSISFRVKTAWGGLDIRTDSNFSTKYYTHISFAARASRNNQKYSVYLKNSSNQALSAPKSLSNYGGNPITTSWRVYNIPLNDLNASDVKLGSVVIHDDLGAAQPAVYIDAIQFISK